MITSWDECKLLDLPKITNAMGNLTAIENTNMLPFNMQRIYYLYQIPENTERGNHAHRAVKRLMIAISGQFQIELDNGHIKRTFTLDRADQGLYIPPMYWCRLAHFSSHSVCIVLASELFDESDYIRSYDEFLNLVHKETL